MAKRIVFHIEGGISRKADRFFRQAFRAFFAELAALGEANGIAMRFEMEGSRRETCNRFCNGIRNDKDALHILLVDSEAPVLKFGEVWQHLKARDGWERPTGASDNQCHLMAQAMEAWFFADPDTLAAYYGQRFRRSSLPATNNVEQIPKDDHIPKLNAATKQTQKGRYDKFDHAPEILERLDAKKVWQRAPHCERLFAVVSAYIEAE